MQDSQGYLCHHALLLLSKLHKTEFESLMATTRHMFSAPKGKHEKTLKELKEKKRKENSSALTHLLQVQLMQSLLLLLILFFDVI